MWRSRAEDCSDWKSGRFRFLSLEFPPFAGPRNSKDRHLVKYYTADSDKSYHHIIVDSTEVLHEFYVGVASLDDDNCAELKWKPRKGSNCRCCSFLILSKCDAEESNQGTLECLRPVSVAQWFANCGISCQGIESIRESLGVLLGCGVPYFRLFCEEGEIGMSLIFRIVIYSYSFFPVRINIKRPFITFSLWFTNSPRMLN